MIERTSSTPSQCWTRQERPTSLAAPHTTLQHTWTTPARSNFTFTVLTFFSSLTMNTSNPIHSKEKDISLSFLPTPPSSELSASRSSSSSSSLSQPAECVFQIFQSIKQHGRLDNPWKKLYLEPTDFTLLEERLKAEELWGFVCDKIRYLTSLIVVTILTWISFDYDCRTCLLVFRMPRPIHEIFTWQVTNEIIDQLKCLRADETRPDSATLAQSIECAASSDIFVVNNSSQSKHSPDASFHHLQARFPAVVLETSFTQKRKDLSRLADDYIVGTYGNIEMLIGLDIEYARTRRATVSVWENKEGWENGTAYSYARKTVDSMVFSVVTSRVLTNLSSPSGTMTALLRERTSIWSSPCLFLQPRIVHPRRVRKFQYHMLPSTSSLSTPNPAKNSSTVDLKNQTLGGGGGGSQHQTSSWRTTAKTNL